MKLFVSSTIPSIDKNFAQYLLKRVGITKKIDIFSPCYSKQCCCKKFKKFEDRLEIRFENYSSNIVNKIKIYISNSLKNIFIKNENDKLITWQVLAGAYIYKEKTICLFPDVIICSNSSFNDVLKHELLHFINNKSGHCKENCYFNDSTYHLPIHKFCKSCDKKYRSFLKEFNG